MTAPDDTRAQPRDATANAPGPGDVEGHGAPAPVAAYLEHADEAAVCLPERGGEGNARRRVAHPHDGAGADRGHERGEGSGVVVVADGGWFDVAEAHAASTGEPLAS